MCGHFYKIIKYLFVFKSLLLSGVLDDRLFAVNGVFFHLVREHTFNSSAVVCFRDFGDNIGDFIVLQNFVSYCSLSSSLLLYQV